MIKIAIVEDETVYIEQLTEYLEEYQRNEGEDFKITIFRDGDGIIANYKAGFDIILMDIQMKFVDGMAAAEEIRAVDSEVIIMFITNMTQYAIRGYEVDALDYILKPVSYFAFSQKLKRAIERINRRNDIYITLQVKGGILQLMASEIYYVESKGHNLIWNARKGIYQIPGTMKFAAELLSEAAFFRGNHCYLINLEHVEGVQDKCAVVKGERLQISRSKMKQFMQALTDYWGMG